MMKSSNDESFIGFQSKGYLSSTSKINENLITHLDLNNSLINQLNKNTSVAESKRQNKKEIKRFVKQENIQMLTTNCKNRYEIDKVLESASIENISREALHKTFDLNENQIKSESEKCIDFWRSIVEKNVSPMKCTITENKKKEPKQTTVSKISKKSSFNEKPDIAKETSDAIHARYKEMYVETVRKLQKKRLKDFKSIGKARCKVCSSIDEQTFVLSKNNSELDKIIKNKNNSMENEKLKDEKGFIKSDEGTNIIILNNSDSFTKDSIYHDFSEKSSTSSNYEQQSILRTSKTKYPLGIKLSMLIPETGEIEEIKREIVKDTQWSNPKVEKISSILLKDTKSSIDRLKDKMKISSSIKIHLMDN